MLFLSKCTGHREPISVLWKTLVWSIVCSDAHSENYAQYVHIKTCRFPLECADSQIQNFGTFHGKCTKSATKISSNSI